MQSIESPAELYATLSRQEGEHLATLERRTEGVALPAPALHSTLIFAQSPPHP